MNLYDITKKISGPISPIGCTATDKDRYQNLLQVIELTASLLAELQCIHENNIDSHEASRSEAANLIEAFFEDYAYCMDVSPNSKGEAQ